MVKLTSLPFKIRNKLKVLSVIVIFNIILVISMAKMQKGKEIKGNKLEKKE